MICYAFRHNFLVYSFVSILLDEATFLNFFDAKIQHQSWHTRVLFYLFFEVEVPAEKYKETKLTFEVMHMEIDGMLKQLEVLHWWRNPPEVRNRVFVLEAELKSCKERLRYLKGEESELLKSCLTVDLPSSPIQPIKTTKSNHNTTFLFENSAHSSIHNFFNLSLIISRAWEIKAVSWWISNFIQSESLLAEPLQDLKFVKSWKRFSL